MLDLSILKLCFLVNAKPPSLNTFAVI
ncbi:hypothetical protein FOXYSP1_13076 [Fusarium oxysporum f. sp. phaseoli]